MIKTLKSSLKRNRVTVGSWLTLAHPSIAEIMAKSGFEWLAVDMEHSAITISQAQQLIQVIQLCDVTPLVRVGENTPLLIKRAMDAGAFGVIVPMVNSREDAQRAVEAVKYPPLGTRGVGLARAQGYGMEFNTYKKWLNKNSIVIVQIEHIRAIDNLEDILKVAGVDSFIIGPYDLSASLGHPGEFNKREVKDALKKVERISRLLNIPAGFHVVEPDTATLRRKIKEGYKFLAYSLDTLLLGRFCQESLRKIKE